MYPFAHTIRAYLHHETHSSTLDSFNHWIKCTCNVIGERRQSAWHEKVRHGPQPGLADDVTCRSTTPSIPNEFRWLIGLLASFLDYCLCMYAYMYQPKKQNKKEEEEGKKGQLSNRKKAPSNSQKSRNSPEQPGDQQGHVPLPSTSTSAYIDSTPGLFDIHYTHQYRRAHTLGWYLPG